MATNKILNREDIELLCSFINKIANVSESIDDINLKTDGTFSSVKIDSLLKQLKEENKDYTDEQILKVKNTAIKVIDNLDKAIDEGIIYLYKSPDSDVYSRYLIIDGILTPLDNITINLDNIYTKNEIDKITKQITDDLGSTELTTTATTIKEAINELKDSLDNINTNEESIFEELTQAEYDSLANKNDNIIRYITDTKVIILNDIIYSNNVNSEDVVDIVTTLDNTVTDKQIVGAKCLNDIIGNESLTTTAISIKGAINELKANIDNIGSGNASFDELTQAEYDALTDTNDNIIHYITDTKVVALNGIIYGNNVGNENVVDIITTLDDTATDTQVLGAKSLNDIIGNEVLTTTATTLKGAINELKDSVENIDFSDLTDMINGLHQELTQAEYDALTDDEKANGTIRYITDKNYIIVNNIEYGKSNGGSAGESGTTNDGISIYKDYSEFPNPIEKDVIVFAKEDWTDAFDGKLYVKGFYLANKTTNIYTSLVEAISEIPTLDWVSGITGKPFETLSTDFIVEGADAVLKINPQVHDTINTEIQALKSAIDKSATINDESVLATDTWSAEKIILELDTKASKDTEHIHDNKPILDKFNEDINGLPTYNGSSFMTTAIYDTDNNGIIDKATESEKLTGMIATIDEINYLTGTTSNIQQQINSISSGMLFKGEFDTFAQMSSTLSSPEKGWLVYILQDEITNQENVQYVHDGNDWVYGGGRTVVNEASDTIKGTILLAGDLTGTASSPQLKDVTTASTVGYIKGLEVDSKGRILSITEDTTLLERIAKLEARPQVYVSTDEPQNMINGDIWIQA